MISDNISDMASGNGSSSLGGGSPFQQKDALAVQAARAVLVGTSCTGSIILANIISVAIIFAILLLTLMHLHFYSSEHQGEDGLEYDDEDGCDVAPQHHPVFLEKPHLGQIHRKRLSNFFSRVVQCHVYLSAVLPCHMHCLYNHLLFLLIHLDVMFVLLVLLLWGTNPSSTSETTVVLALGLCSSLVSMLERFFCTKLMHVTFLFLRSHEDSRKHYSHRIGVIVQREEDSSCGAYLAEVEGGRDVRGTTGGQTSGTGGGLLSLSSERDTSSSSGSARRHPMRHAPDVHLTAVIDVDDLVFLESGGDGAAAAQVSCPVESNAPSSALRPFTAEAVPISFETLKLAAIAGKSRKKAEGGQNVQNPPPMFLPEDDAFYFDASVAELYKEDIGKASSASSSDDEREDRSRSKDSSRSSVATLKRAAAKLQAPPTPGGGGSIGTDNVSGVLYTYRSLHGNEGDDDDDGDDKANDKLSRSSAAPSSPSPRPLKSPKWRYLPSTTRALPPLLQVDELGNEELLEGDLEFPTDPNELRQGDKGNDDDDDRDINQVKESSFVYTGRNAPRKPVGHLGRRDERNLPPPASNQKSRNASSSLEQSESGKMFLWSPRRRDDFGLDRLESSNKKNSATSQNKWLESEENGFEAVEEQFVNSRRNNNRHIDRGEDTSIFMIDRKSAAMIWSPREHHREDTPPLTASHVDSHAYIGHAATSMSKIIAPPYRHEDERKSKKTMKDIDPEDALQMLLDHDDAIDMLDDDDGDLQDDCSPRSKKKDSLTDYDQTLAQLDEDESKLMADVDLGLLSFIQEGDECGGGDDDDVDVDALLKGDHQPRIGAKEEETLMLEDGDQDDSGLGDLADDFPKVAKQLPAVDQLTGPCAADSGERIVEVMEFNAGDDVGSFGIDEGPELWRDRVRDDEMAMTEHPLAANIATRQRQALEDEISVGGFDEDEVEAKVVVVKPVEDAVVPFDIYGDFDMSGLVDGHSSPSASAGTNGGGGTQRGGIIEDDGATETANTCFVDFGGPIAQLAAAVQMKWRSAIGAFVLWGLVLVVLFLIAANLQGPQCRLLVQTPSGILFLVFLVDAGVQTVFALLYAKFFGKVSQLPMRHAEEC